MDDRGAWTVPFRGIEMDFGFGEKVLVILHGLPVLDHQTRPHILGYKSIVFDECMEERIKQ